MQIKEEKARTNEEKHRSNQKYQRSTIQLVLYSHHLLFHFMCSYSQNNLILVWSTCKYHFKSKGEQNQNQALKNKGKDGFQNFNLHLILENRNCSRNFITTSKQKQLGFKQQQNFPSPRKETPYFVKTSYEQSQKSFNLFLKALFRNFYVFFS